MASVIASSVGIVIVAIALAVACKVKQNQKLLSGLQTQPNTTAEMIRTDSGSQNAFDVTLRSLRTSPRQRSQENAQLPLSRHLPGQGATPILSQRASDVTYAYPSALHLPRQPLQLPQQAVQGGQYAVTTLNVQVLEVHNLQRASSATYHYPYIGSTFPRGIKPPGFPDNEYGRYEVGSDEDLSISSMEENDDVVNQESFFVPATVNRAYGIELCPVV